VRAYKDGEVAETECETVGNPRDKEFAVKEFPIRILPAAMIPWEGDFKTAANKEPENQDPGARNLGVRG